VNVGLSIWKTVESWVERVWEMTGPRPTVDRGELELEHTVSVVGSGQPLDAPTGDRWHDTKMKYGLDDDTMFELFKKPFLLEIAQKKKPVRFTHHPIEDGDYFLQQEFRFLRSMGYTFDADAMTMNPAGESGETMLVANVIDLSRAAQTYFGSKGVCLAVSPADAEVQLLLYGVEVFYLRMPDPRMTTFSFAYQVSEKIRTFDYFGEWLSAQNTTEDLDRAFGVIDRFARLRLPDKYLEAWDAALADDETRRSV
jgi:hypothetical protein